MNHTHSGFVFLNKPAGVTSFKSLSVIKKDIYPVKVGHTGTLDKFAEGLIIAVIGKLTKFASYITALDKEYIAELEFGKETETLDPEGAVIQKNDHIPDLDTVQQKIDKFVGEQEQVPPVFSAVHVKGKRAHVLAREGKIPDMKSRKIVIYGIDIFNYSPPFLQIQVRCSKGTYIRSLARDLGVACGTYAYVTKLKRTKIGKISVEEAVTTSDFSMDRDIISPSDFFKRLSFINTLHVKETYKDYVIHGKQLKSDLFAESIIEEGLCAVFDNKQDFLALIESEKGIYRYKFVGA